MTVVASMYALAVDHGCSAFVERYLAPRATGPKQRFVPSSRERAESRQMVVVTSEMSYAA